MKITSAFHAEQEEHGDDGKEGSNGIDDDVLQGVVVGDEQDVEHRGRGQVARQKATGIGENGTDVEESHAEEHNRPNAMESLKKNNQMIQLRMMFIQMPMLMMLVNLF